jgi:hypothetical protein
MHAEPFLAWCGGGCNAAGKHAWLAGSCTLSDIIMALPMPCHGTQVEEYMEEADLGWEGDGEVVPSSQVWGLLESFQATLFGNVLG